MKLTREAIQRMISQKQGTTSTTIIEQGGGGGGGATLGPLLTSLNAEAMPVSEGYLHWTGSAWAFDTPTGGDPVDLTPYAQKTWVQNNFAYKSDLTALLTKADADGYYAPISFVKPYLPLAAGSSYPLTGSLYITGNSGITWVGGYGMLCFKPTSSWSGVNENQWGVGSHAAQGVIRSSFELKRYDGTYEYTIYDSSNLDPLNYIRKDGGTVTGTLNVKSYLNIQSAAGTNEISFDGTTPNIYIASGGLITFDSDSYVAHHASDDTLRIYGNNGLVLQGDVYVGSVDSSNAVATVGDVDALEIRTRSWVNGKLSQFVTSIGVSGNNLTWTKNGSTTSITVPYATKAGSLDVTAMGNDPSLADSATGTFAFSVNNLLAPNDWYDYAGLQVGYSADKWQLTALRGHLYIRQNDNGGTSYTGWSAWSQVLDAGNWSTFINLSQYATSAQLLDVQENAVYSIAAGTGADAGKLVYTTGGNVSTAVELPYLPLTAGSSKPLTGDLYMSLANNDTERLIYFNGLDSLSYAKGTVNGTVSHGLFLGYDYNGSEDITEIYGTLLVFHTGTGRAERMRIESNGVAKFSKKPQVGSGNNYTEVALLSDLNTAIDNFATTAATTYATKTQLGGYLPLTGGRMTGNIIMAGAGGTTRTDSAKIEFKTYVSSDYPYYAPYIQAIDEATYGRKRLSVFQKNVADWDTPQVEVFTIKPDGKVGIGNPHPAYMLDVDGTFHASGNATFDRYIAIDGGYGITFNTDSYIINTSSFDGIIVSGMTGVKINAGQASVEKVVVTSSLTTVNGQMKIAGSSSSSYVTADNGGLTATNFVKAGSSGFVLGNALHDSHIKQNAEQYSSDTTQVIEYMVDAGGRHFFRTMNSSGTQTVLAPIHAESLNFESRLSGAAIFVDNGHVYARNSTGQIQMIV